MKTVITQKECQKENRIKIKRMSKKLLGQHQAEDHPQHRLP